MWFGAGDRCVQNFGGNRLGKQLLRKLTRIWMGNIKTDVWEIDLEGG
jgi:hypothetical protein